MGNVLKLPDCYRKENIVLTYAELQEYTYEELQQFTYEKLEQGKECNNSKLLRLNELAIADLNKDMQDCLNCLDLQQATGKTLDLYGAMLEQKRGNLNDEQYRVVLSSRLGANVSKGTISDVIDKLCAIYNCNKEDISFSDGETSGEVKVSKLLLEAISKAGFTTEQAIQILSSFIPAGVRITEVNVEGTFEFGSTEMEYDEKKGFGNEQQTIGGFFGMIFSENSLDLPL